MPTSQTPCALNARTKSGSSAGALSFSYCNSSPSFCDSDTSAAPTSSRQRFFRVTCAETDSPAPSPNLRADTENERDTAGPARIANTGRAARDTERAAPCTAKARLDERESWRRVRMADMMVVRKREQATCA